LTIAFRYDIVCEINEEVLEMANLIGTLQGNRGSVSRLGSKVIHSRLATWTHDIYTWLDKDGNYKIQISKIGSCESSKIIEGNVNK